MSEMSEKAFLAFMELGRFNSAFSNAIGLHRKIYSPDADYLEPAEAKISEKLVRISLSEPGEEIDSNSSGVVALLMRAYKAAGISFKDKGVKTVKSDDEDAFVHTLEVDIYDKNILEKLARAMLTVIPAVAGIKAMQEAARNKDGRYNREAVPSEEDIRGFAEAVAELAGVKAVFQGAKVGRSKG
jgi:hypothetical protein